MTRRLTVIIPTCNRRDRLDRCLSALERQTVPKDVFEVVIADDGSNDGTGGMLQARTTDLRLKVARQPNRGPAAARNLAIRAAEGEILLIINDDTLLTDTALEQHLKAHDRPGWDKGIALGNFRILPEYKSHLFTALIDSTTFMFPFCRVKTRELVDFSFFITCNTSLRRAAFQEAGLFDESFPKPAGEDIEMGYRLHRAGWRIEFMPELMSYHDSTFTPASYARARFIRGEEDLRFLHKHPEQIRIYQRHAMAFVKSHFERLKDHHEDYKAYVDSVVAETDGLIARCEPAEGAERYRLMHELLGRIEAIGYLAYAQGAGVSPFFQDVIGKIYPQAVF